MTKLRPDTEKLIKEANSLYHHLEKIFVPLDKNDPQFQERWDLLYAARKLGRDIWEEHDKYIMSTVGNNQELLTKEQVGAFFKNYEESIDFRIKSAEIHNVGTEEEPMFLASEAREVLEKQEANNLTKMVRLSEEWGEFDAQEEMDWEGPWRLCHGEIIRKGHPDW